MTAAPRPLHPSEPAPVLLTVPEAARRLRISRATLYVLIGQGLVPVVRFKGTRLVRISTAAIERLIDESTGLDRS